MRGGPPLVNVSHRPDDRESLHEYLVCGITPLSRLFRGVGRNDIFDFIGTWPSIGIWRQNKQLHQFLVERCLRIYPVYYLSLLVGIPFFILRSYYYTGDALSGFSKLDLGDITLSITGFYAYAGKWGGPFVETSWFIGLIMTMYLFFIFLSPTIEKYPFISIGSLLLTSIISRIVVSRTGCLPVRPMDWFPLYKVFEFSLGIYLAKVLPRNIWLITGPLKRLTSSILVLSELSLPLFLVHQPLLPRIHYLMIKGLSPFLASAAFLSVSLIASWAAFTVNKKILASFLSIKIRDQMVRT